MGTLVSLTEFQPIELQLLHQLLSCNRDNLVDTKKDLVTISKWLPGPHLRDNRYASTEGFRSLLSKTYFVSFLVEQLEAVLSRKVPIDQAIDLSKISDPNSFLGYLEYELHRNELGTQYTQKAYKTSQTAQCLLDAFSLEYRFLSLLYHQLKEKL